MHKVRLSIEDVCGKPIVPNMESNLPLEPVIAGFDTAAVNMILNMQRLQIQRPDKYMVRFFVDDEELAVLPLYILEPPQAKPQAPETDDAKIN